MAFASTLWKGGLFLSNDPTIASIIVPDMADTRDTTKNYSDNNIPTVSEWSTKVITSLCIEWDKKTKKIVDPMVQLDKGQIFVKLKGSPYSALRTDMIKIVTSMHTLSAFINLRRTAALKYINAIKSQTKVKQPASDIYKKVFSNM